MLVYCWEVPEFIQHKMRLEQIAKAGTIEEVNAPIDRYVEALMTIYNMTKKRWEDVNKNPLETMTFTPDFNQVLRLEYETLRKIMQGSRDDVAVIAGNFTTRLMKILYKMSVLCSVASAPSINNEEDRFKVTGHNVRQAARIIKQCYMTLVDWLERTMRQKKRSIAENNLEPIFVEIYDKLNKDDELS